MNIVSILQSIDLSKISPDALPDGMSLGVAQQRILCSTAAFFDRILAETPAIASVPAFRPSHVAEQAVRQASQDERVTKAKPATPAATKVVDSVPEARPPIAQPEDKPIEPAKPDVNPDQAENIFEMIGEASSLAAIEKVQAEQGRYIDAMRETFPDLTDRLWSAMRARIHELRTSAQTPVPDVGRPQISRTLGIMRDTFAAPADKWEAFRKGRSIEVLLKGIRNNPTTAPIIESAKAHHPDLYQQIEDVLTKGRA